MDGPAQAPTLAVSVPFPAPATRPFWSYVRGLLAPLVIWGLVVAVLARPVEVWLSGQDSYDQDALKEWLDESRGFRDTLPEMVEHYLKLKEADRQRVQPPLVIIPGPNLEAEIGLKKEEICEHTCARWAAP